jgi:S1-C subfamily serine protease
VGPIEAGFWGFLEFSNEEVVPCRARYKDPVHDYSYLEYDVKEVKWPVVEISMFPDLAQVGTQVFLIGNDAGEKLSFHSGVISVINKNAPEYGLGYNDFNTNYIQAASGTKMGSSGSPVLSSDGRCIALVAGGHHKSATNFYLPLDRPLRALHCLQNGQAITRGTIQCQWLLSAYHQCQARGLNPECEEQHRKAFPGETGMLVAHRVLPEGPAASVIEVGDILCRVNGKPIGKFHALDEILDTSVGCKLRMELQRHGRDIEVEVQVQDLHKITPSRCVSVAGAGFNELSYQMARCYGVAAKGVFVNNASGSFEGLEYSVVLEAINGTKVPHLNDFLEAMRRVAHQERVDVSYRRLRSPKTIERFTMVNESYWSKLTEAVQNPETLLWVEKEYETVPELPPKCISVVYPETQGTSVHIQGKERCFVMVSYTMPIGVNGFPRSHRPQPGVVLDSIRGFIYVSQFMAPSSLCDFTINFADSDAVSGKLYYQDFQFGFCVVKYDPSLIEGAVQHIVLSPELLAVNTSLHFVGMTLKGLVVSNLTTVTSLEPLNLPANKESYRAMNLENFKVDTLLEDDCPSGFLVDNKGKVRAIWTEYEFWDQRIETGGFPASVLFPILEKLQKGQQPNRYMLSVEFVPISIIEARDMGVAESWIKRVLSHSKTHHQLLMVKRRVDEVSVLEEGDIILTFNKNLITRYFEINLPEDKVEAQIIRNRQEMIVHLRATTAHDFEPQRMIEFCGATLQAPPFSIKLQTRTFSQVYITAQDPGSPAALYRLNPGQFITSVNGQPTPDLDTFLIAAKALPNSTCMLTSVY